MNERGAGWRPIWSISPPAPFLPFPTGVRGDLFDNPLALSIYAVTVALVSGPEVLQFRVAFAAGSGFANRGLHACDPVPDLRPALQLAGEFALG